MLAAFAVLSLAGCASSLDAIPPISDTASFIDTSEQVLKSGDSLRLVVFGADDLSGSYRLDDAGRLKLGSLGTIDAQGLTAGELEQRVAEHLAARGVANAQVSVVIN